MIQPGKLYIVSTPIGNMGDITYRAVETLKNVDLIACEDTRHSQGLLKHYGIVKPLTSYFDFSEREKTFFLIDKIKNGMDIALISDAGTPGISDPGYRLITEAIKQGVAVESLPGASAILSALVVSGLPTDRFTFEGFLPIKPGARLKKLKGLKKEERTVIFYESPHRLLKSLEAVQEALGDIPIVVARELTKKFEEVTRENVSKLIAHYSKRKPLGEFVILWNLLHEAPRELPPAENEDELRQQS